MNILRTMAAAMQSSKSALSLDILAECSTSKARACRLSLPHCPVDLPVFMPVGTQGTLKGLTVHQLMDVQCHLMLGNTYHLGHRPVRLSLHLLKDETSAELQVLFRDLTFSKKLADFTNL